MVVLIGGWQGSAIPPQAEMQEPETTANERVKRRYASVFWGAMIVATFLHVGAFALWPELSAEDFSFETEELVTIELPPEIEIPPPPQQIARPATPVIATADIDEDITIAPTTFEDNPVQELPPPPEERAVDISAQPTFTPMTVRPEIDNVEEVVRAMEREYPPLLRDAGIGGTVLVHFFIDEEGIVQNAVIAESSGHQALDEASLKVAPIYRFRPAMNRDKRVPVWVQLGVTWRVR